MLILISIFFNYVNPYVKFLAKTPVNNARNLQELPLPAH